MSSYDLIIISVTIGFFLLAYTLLAPVYRFLQREEKASQQWTPEVLAARQMEAKSPEVHSPNVDDLPVN